MGYAPHIWFFRVGIFFLIGVALASGTVAFASAAVQALFILCAIALAVLVTHTAGRKDLVPFLVIGTAAGAVYFLAYAGLHRDPSIRFGTKTEIRGIVIRTERRINGQILTLDDYLRISTNRYPEFNYGDAIRLEGTPQKSKSPFFSGTVNAWHVKITVTGRHKGNALKERLLGIKNSFEGKLKEMLPHDQAAFLAGLTMGNTEEFSKEFSDELRASGTTHLVALSGANITGIMYAVAAALLLFLPRRNIFWPLFAIMILFVVMTGAESSLVRAAVMTSIFMAGQRLERASSFGNALIAAALGMTLWDPRLLVFDLGFQLSFVAIMGLAYLKPVLEKYSPIKNELFLTSLAAQLAVMPVLYAAVGRATPWAIFPNMLLAPVIPTTVGLGFLTGAAAFVHPIIAFVPAWLTGILLTYEMAVVRLFAFGM